MNPPTNWMSFLQPEIPNSYWLEMAHFIEKEREKHTIYPTKENVYAAFERTPPEKVCVVILGQDPYHGPGQAHGLSFSVPKGEKIPPSLRNIYKELLVDQSIETPLFGDLSKWADQGVLLINSVFTVIKKQPGSHLNAGWEKLTDTLLKKLSQQERPIVFILWGNKAAEKKHLLNNKYHLVLTTAHPSPLSAHRGFFGSQPFSKTNAYLEKNGVEKIDWNVNA